MTPADAPPLQLRPHAAIADIDGDVWDRLAARGDSLNPFISHRFLHALEASGSVGDGTGWRPIHLTLEQAAGPEGPARIVAAAPAYLKSHSYGEFVFDQHWADAFARAGGAYYPKLLIGSPFTPVAGPRFLAPDALLRRALADAAVEAARRLGVSSLHVNFVDEADAAAAGAAYLRRAGVQYHWFNRGYSDFEGFLAGLSSRKRKAIRRERRDAAASGLTIRRLQGEDITPAHWDAFWAFYQDTGARKWGRPYLTRTFFEIAATDMKDDILLIVAERAGTPVAGALNFIGGEALYGRYWGCTEHHPFLHFELCYHQAVEYAIEQGLSRVEAGAQGEHKIARGYEPVATGSLHWIADPAFRSAVADYLDAERRQTAAEIDYLSDFTPYRKDADPDPDAGA